MAFAVAAVAVVVILPSHPAATSHALDFEKQSSGHWVDSPIVESRHYYFVNTLIVVLAVAAASLSFAAADSREMKRLQVAQTKRGPPSSTVATKKLNS